MTILILDPSEELLPPYASWLRDSGADLVAFAAAPGSVDDRNEYAEVRVFEDYARWAAVENAALELATRTKLSAIVATGEGDLIRAGALRDHLGLAGMGRASAIALRDLVAMRERLAQAGLAVVPVGPVQQPADVYRYAHAWGYPVRIRRRRVSGWPMVALLDGEPAANAHTEGGLGVGPARMPGLAVEPGLVGERYHRVAAVADLGELASAAVSALWSPAAGRFQVELVRTADGRVLVDTVRFADPGADGVHRALTRAQAGLEPGEVVA